MSDTSLQYRSAVDRCRGLFLAKASDYGTAWQMLRLPSVTDQLFIKARRIRTLEETGVNRVGDSVEDEFIGLINYCAIALMLLENMAKGINGLEAPDILLAELTPRYDAAIHQAWSTLEKKNHDYGEAWRDMRVSSFTDLILMKLMRIKQLENNGGPSRVSEGVDASYIDILNYAVFALILIDEKKK